MTISVKFKVLQSVLELKEKKNLRKILQNVIYLVFLCPWVFFVILDLNRRESGMGICEKR